MTIPQQAQNVNPGLPASVPWSAVPYPVLIADPEGTVRLANPQAVFLFPGLVEGEPLAGSVPAWLAEGHRARQDSLAGLGEAAALRPPIRLLTGEVGDRSFEAHPTTQDNDDTVWWLVDDTDHRLARDALRMERERTAFLTESSNALLSTLNLERCMDVTAGLAAEHLADAAVVVAPRTTHQLPMVTCVRATDPERSHRDIDPSELPGLGEALQGFPPVSSRWIDPACAPEWLTPDGFGPIGSIVVTPLPGHGVPAGALILLRRSRDEAFSDAEEVFARLFAARAGAAMSAARLYAEQAALTQTLMRDLLPPILRQVDGVDFAGGYRPSKDHERIGGDFYDVHPGLSHEASFAVLGDVCGKGLEAAVLTGKIRNTLQALLPLAQDHQQMISLLNGALLSSHHARFATLVMASVKRDGGNVRMRITSAGHPPPLIVRSDGTVEEVASRGTLVGVLPEARSFTTRTTLGPGEFAVLFTDGFTEAKGGPTGDELFGDARLEAALTGCAQMPAQAVVEHLQMLASDWVGDGDHDDMAVMVIAAPRSNHLSAVDGHTRGRFTA